MIQAIKHTSHMNRCSLLPIVLMAFFSISLFSQSQKLLAKDNADLTPSLPFTADAGEDKTIYTKKIVMLDGRKSIGKPIQFKWFFLSIPETSDATLLYSRTNTPVFLADRKGTYIVQLIVTQDENEDYDTVIVSAINKDLFYSSITAYIQCNKKAAVDWTTQLIDGFGKKRTLTTDDKGCVLYKNISPGCLELSISDMVRDNGSSIEGTLLINNELNSGATVICQTSQNVEHETVTDNNGFYYFDQVPQGDIKIILSPCVPAEKQ